MLLLAYIIDGQAVGVDLVSWDDDALNGNKPFIASNEVLSGYKDISSIENWDSFGSNCTDFNTVRDNIQALVIAIVTPNFSKWNDLTLLQKQISCKYITAPYQLRVPAIVTDQEDEENWRSLLIKTKSDRDNCVESMRLAVGEYIRTGALTTVQTQQFFKDVDDYIEWFTQANIPDFKNWIFGLPPYEGIFASKDYYSVGLQQKLEDIYNGVAP